MELDARRDLHHPRELVRWRLRHGSCDVELRCKLAEVNTGPAVARLVEPAVREAARLVNAGVACSGKQDTAPIGVGLKDQLAAAHALQRVLLAGRGRCAL